MVKKLFKYGTGEVIPKDAVYLTTLVEEYDPKISDKMRLVWHYFLVDKEE